MHLHQRSQIRCLHLRRRSHPRMKVAYNLFPKNSQLAKQNIPPKKTTHFPSRNSTDPHHLTNLLQPVQELLHPLPRLFHILRKLQYLQRHVAIQFSSDVGVEGGQCGGLGRGLRWSGTVTYFVEVVSGLGEVSLNAETLECWIEGYEFEEDLS